MSERKLPKIGVGVIIRRGNKVLFGQRLNAHGHQSWSFPGGHLEYGESIESCAVREAMEETGVKVKVVKVGPITNDVFRKESKHYVTIFVIGDWVTGEAQLTEPDKMHRWKWVTWDNLPEPLFLPTQHLVDSGFSPFES